MLRLFLLILAALYTINPYDIVPDFLIGTGWFDDLIVWIILWRYLASRKRRNATNSYFYQGGGSRFENSNHYDHEYERRGEAAGQNSKETAFWDPYRTLGVEQGATESEIKSAYRELANKYHPDKLEHLGDEFKALAESRFKEIQRAYQELNRK